MFTQFTKNAFSDIIKTYVLFLENYLYYKKRKYKKIQE